MFILFIDIILVNDKGFKLEYEFKDVDFCSFHDIKFLLNVFRNYNITSEKELPYVYMVSKKYPIWVEKSKNFINYFLI